MYLWLTKCQCSQACICILFTKSLESIEWHSENRCCQNGSAKNTLLLLYTVHSLFSLHDYSSIVLINIM